MICTDCVYGPYGFAIYCKPCVDAARVRLGIATPPSNGTGSTDTEKAPLTGCYFEGGRPDAGKLLDALAERDATIAGLRKDAARYRWLRNSNSRDINICDWSECNYPSDSPNELFGSDADAAIDAALAKGDV